MLLRSLLEPRNAVAESRGKWYLYGANTLTVMADEEARRSADAPGRYTVPATIPVDLLGEAVLFDYFGTMPDPKLAARFQEQFIAGRRKAQGSILGFGGMQIHEWLDEDCVIPHEPDGSSGYCTLAEQEGLIRLAVRRLRGL